jgi:uncharacterized protein (DUF305 family)
MKQITTGIVAIAVLLISSTTIAIGETIAQGIPHRGGGHGGMGMGMMSGEQGDRVFLEEMIPHHKMALMMTSHIVDSDRPELRTLAKNIMQTQTAEIEQMRQWYNTWYQK